MLLNIFSNKYAIQIIYHLIETPNLSFKISEIKDKTNLSNKALYSGINTLISNQVLIKKKSKYELNFNYEKIEFLIKFLKEEKKEFKLISTKDFLNIKKILSFLEDKNFQEVYLFGSFAKGTQKINSDYDIAIISQNKLEISDWQFNFQQKGINVEFHLINKIQKDNLLHKEILNKSKLLLKK